VGVLLEPRGVGESIAQAYEIHVPAVWRPRRAAVMGAGTIGLLATLVFDFVAGGDNLRAGSETLSEFKLMKPSEPLRITQTPDSDGAGIGLLT